MRGCIAVITLALLGACSSTAPKCSDSRTTDTAMEIVQKKFAGQIGEDAVKQLGLKLINIRTTGLDEKLGKYTCAADLEISGPRGSKSVPIRYTSELTDDGKSFYVTVYGL